MGADGAAEDAAAIEAEERALQEELEDERETLEGDVGSELDDAMEWDDWEPDDPDRDRAGREPGHGRTGGAADVPRRERCGAPPGREGGQFVPRAL